MNHNWRSFTVLFLLLMVTISHIGATEEPSSSRQEKPSKSKKIRHRDDASTSTSTSTSTSPDSAKNPKSIPPPGPSKTSPPPKEDSSRISVESERAITPPLWPESFRILRMGQTAMNTQPTNGPRLTFSCRTHNFGEIRPDTIQKAIFPIRNDGTAPLSILEIRAGCGCTVAELEKSVLPPGETSAISVEYHSGGKGHQVKTLYIHSNDVQYDVMEFEISADVIPEIAWPDDMIRYKDISRQKKFTHSITLSVRHPEGLVISELASDRAWLIPKLVHKKGGPWEIRVDYIPEAAREEPGDYLTGTITFSANRPGFQHAVIPVHLRFRPQYVTTPQIVVQYNQDPSIPVVRDLSVTSPDGHSTQILTCVSAHPNVQCKVILSSKQESSIRVTVVNGNTTEAIQTVLRIKLPFQTLHIPVSVMFRKPT